MKQRLAGFREGLEKLGWSERGNSSSLTALKPWRRCLLHQPPHSIGRSMQDSPTRGQVILVLLLGVLWGLNWPTVKIALAEIGPWTLRASALSLASLALVAITLIRGGTLRIRRAYWWRIALPAVLAISAPNVLIAYAQLSAPTGRIAVVAFTMPVWAIIFARLVLGEPLDKGVFSVLLSGSQASWRSPGHLCSEVSFLSGSFSLWQPRSAGQPVPCSSRDSRARLPHSHLPPGSS